MLFETTLCKHTILMDVPAAMGGADRAATPPQVFVASIGACVAALVADYCRHHDLDLTGLQVEVDFDKAD